MSEQKEIQAKAQEIMGKHETAFLIGHSLCVHRSKAIAAITEALQDKIWAGMAMKLAQENKVLQEKLEALTRESSGLEWVKDMDEWVKQTMAGCDREFNDYDKGVYDSLQSIRERLEIISALSASSQKQNISILTKKNMEIDRLKIELDMTQQNLQMQKQWDENTINELRGSRPQDVSDDVAGNTEQPFERFPSLASSIEWFANNVVCPGSEWNKLVSEINKAISSQPLTPIGQEREGLTGEQAEAIASYWLKNVANPLYLNSIEMLTDFARYISASSQPSKPLTQEEIEKMAEAEYSKQEKKGFCSNYEIAINMFIAGIKSIT